MSARLSLPQTRLIHIEETQAQRPKTLSKLMLCLESRFQNIADSFIGQPKTEQLIHNIKYALEQEALSFIYQFNLFAIQDMIFGTIAEIVEGNFKLPKQLELDL